MASEEPEIGELHEASNKFVFHWRIAHIINLSFPDELGRSLRSSTFYFNDDCFFMRLYLCGTKENREKVALCLSRADPRPGKCPRFQLGIQKVMEDPVSDGFPSGGASSGAPTSWRPTTSSNQPSAWKLDEPQFLCRRTRLLQKFIDAPRAKLNAYCEFLEPLPHCSTASLFNRLWNLSRDMEAMLKGEKDADFLVKVGNKRMKVHRAVLESRSEYFTGMLSHDLRENATGQGEIDDIEPDVFSEILSYLYSGEPSLSKENVCGVFVAADKLLLKELKTLCMRYMRQELEPILVCNVLALADKYQEGKLKEDAMRYIGKNASRVFPLDEWKGFTKENPRLACEVLVCVIVKKVYCKE